MNHPPKSLKLESSDDKILWMLNNNPYCQWKDFMENPIRIPRASLSKYINILINKGYIKRAKGERYRIYKITSLGQIKYSEMLDKYDLDPQMLLEEKIKKFKSISATTLNFLNKHRVENSSVKIQFNKYLSMMDYSEKGSLFRNYDHYLLTILFLSLNHPDQTPKFMSIKEFSDRYRISNSSLIHYVETLIEDNPYLFKFFKIDIDSENSYYLPENDTIEILLRQIIEDFVEKKFHDLILDNPTDQINYYLNNKDIIKISELLCDKYSILPKELEFLLTSFLPKYISYLSYELKTEPLTYEGSYLAKKISMRIIQDFTEHYTHDPEYSKVLAFNQEHKDQVEELIHKATVYMSMKNYEQAINIIDEAIELNAEIPMNYCFKAILYLKLNDIVGAQNSIDQSLKLFEDHKLEILDNDLFDVELERCREIKNEIVIRDKMTLAMIALFDVFRERDFQPIKEAEASRLIQLKTNLDLDMIRDALKEILEIREFFDIKDGKIEYKGPSVTFEEAVKVRRPKLNILELFNSFKFEVPNIRNKTYSLEETAEKLSSQLGEFRMLSLLEKSIIDEPDDIKKVYKLIKEEKYNEALLEINKLLELNNENLIYLQFKAFLLTELKKSEEALEFINKAINIDDKNELSYMIKNAILSDQENLEAAVENINLSLKINPTNVSFHIQNLFVAIHSEEENRIIKSLEKFSQLNHNIPFFYFIQSSMYLDSDRFNEALETIEKAINLENENQKFYNLKADALNQLGRYEESLEIINQSIRLDPNKDECYGIKADILFHMSKFENALKHINKAIDINPKFTNYFLQKCFILLVSGKTDEALTLIDSIIEIEPKNWRYYYLKIFLLLELGDDKTAIELFQNLDDLSIDKEDIAYCTLKALLLGMQDDYSNAFKMLDKGFKLEPNNYGTFFVKIRLLIRKGDLEEAWKVVNDAIKLYPNYPDLYLNKTRILMNQGKLDLALESLERAIEIEPSNIDYFQLKARILGDMDKFKDALLSIEHAIEYEPENAFFWHEKAEILKWSKEYEEAIRAINKAIEFDPEWWSHYDEKADIYYYQERYKDSLQELDMAVQLNPENDELFFTKSQTLSIIGEHKKALIEINKAIELNHENIEYYEKKIEILENLDEFEIALKIADELFELFPEEPDPYGFKYNLLYSKEKFTECLKLYEEGIKKFPGIPWFYIGKADVLNKMGQHEEAIHNCKLAFEIDHDSFPINMISDILFELEKQEEALHVFDKYVVEMKDENNKSDLYDYKHRHLMRLKRYDDALDAIDKAIEFNPKNTYLYTHKSYILIKLKKYELAIKVCIKAIQLRITNDRAYYLQGKSLFFTKEYKDAIESLNNAIKYTSISERKFKSNFYLVLCYKEMGDITIAQKHLEECKKLARKENKKEWFEKINQKFPKIS